MKTRPPDTDAAAKEQPEPLKKKRGRPSKAATEATQASIVSSPSDESLKNKRGRPPKNVVCIDTDVNITHEGQIEAETVLPDQAEKAVSVVSLEVRSSWQFNAFSTYFQQSMLEKKRGRRSKAAETLPDEREEEASKRRKSSIAKVRC